MRKLSLSEWAQIGEVVGMVAVVASLGMVIYSLNQNTNALQAGNENVMFELQSELALNIVEDPSFAAIIVKVNAGESLTPVENMRLDFYKQLQLDVWAMAHGRFQHDQIGEYQWEAWNGFFVGFFGEDSAWYLSEQRWEELGYGYDADFWAHVGKALGHTPGE